MAGKKAYLTPREQDHLIEWLVASKEGSYYSRFLEWCENNNIPEDRRFTSSSLDVWLKRRRNKVQQHKREYQELVNDGSVMDRSARVAMLESGVARLTRLINREEELDPELIIKLEEQRRKMLEAVAKERGEFGVKPNDNPSRPTEEYARTFMNHFRERGG